MGSLYNNHCYENSQDATNAFFTASAPTIGPGNPAYLYNVFQWAGDSEWYVRKQNLTTGTYVDYWASPPSFPACDPSETFVDGVIVGWGVVGALVIGWAAHLMKRELR